MIAVIISLKNEENINIPYIILFIGYIAIFMVNKEKIELHFYEISLTFIIVSLIVNWIYLNYIYIHNESFAIKKVESVIDLFKMLFSSIIQITPKSIKNINEEQKREVKILLNKQRTVLYLLAFICSIFAHYGTNASLDSSFTTFIIFDVSFTLFLEQYYFKS